MIRFLRFTARAFLTTAAALLLAFGLPTLLSEFVSRNRTFAVDQAPNAPVAIVFGAGLNRDGRPSPVLRDRVSTAVELYFAGKVQKLLMSGDNSYMDYNEPGAMQSYALELGVPEKDIILDYAGRRTYDTCYRALHIFGVTDALVVTQAYHLPRVLLTCQGLGLNASGVVADQQEYHPIAMQRWRIREVPATLVALWDVYITRPLPVLGKPEPIFSNSKTDPT
ncbi:MAG: SanA/YdcF family protein [Bellilinea sp.]